MNEKSVEESCIERERERVDLFARAPLPATADGAAMTRRLLISYLCPLLSLSLGFFPYNPTT